MMMMMMEDVMGDGDVAAWFCWVDVYVLVLLYTKEHFFIGIHPSR
jgi:hypothetical protein